MAQVQFWIGNFYYLYIKEDFLYQLNNFLSVLKIATTVYEREMRNGDVEVRQLLFHIFYII